MIYNKWSASYLTDLRFHDIMLYYDIVWFHIWMCKQQISLNCMLIFSHSGPMYMHVVWKARPLFAHAFADFGHMLHDFRYAVSAVCSPGVCDSSSALSLTRSFSIISEQTNCVCALYLGSRWAKIDKDIMQRARSVRVFRVQKWERLIGLGAHVCCVH